MWYPGAVYHVMNRGNRKDQIFIEEEDYIIFLKMLKKVQRKYPFRLISYCLMTNHIHLQIQTINTPIGQIMQSLLLNYTKYFNQKYDLSGHLFQGRFTSELIETDSYMMQTSRYIHLNPVKAKMVKMPKDYRWSSYCVYLGRRKCELTADEKILDYFSGNRILYKQYVENNLYAEDVSEEILRYEERVGHDNGED